MNLKFDWPRAHRFDITEGRIKQLPEDFVVIERLPEEPCGEGEHLWLKVRKTGQNTQWLAKQLARWANVKPRDVSFAGLKDRQAVTEQTFSVHLPGKTDPDFSTLNIPNVEILSATRHSRKLKTGQLIGNRFVIRIRDSQLPANLLEQNWQQITEAGVPNYFGAQRFGMGGQNVEKGIQLLNGARFPRHLESLFLSSVRSYLFNLLLAERVKAGTWNTLIPGDFAQFTEGKAGFYCEHPSADDTERCVQGRLSPSGSLPGLSKDEFTALDDREGTVLESFQTVIEALHAKKVSRHFRKFRVIPEQPHFEVIDGDPVISFFLPAGCFATSVIAELCQLTEGDGTECHE
ncbi:tRNA pseudouridine(13) synthase TruD [Reinekea marinisedimentorum]|uniref:tRNA pseudouridine synthase D n=1 Tax=Reinekea marinisedimentorum TaxID=230495 RepID=A0A4R3I6E2_9GAMM|nr:tRNA pseudouridine(13) synthase TruD [Reinekea marinisedimentorum]TCS40732.1 tRNA pseudouridine13 synthase [Reinekea marinisedimentorum]